ncbi:glycosyltransferase family 4 protein [Chengkuizengella marina]|uniref:Glycosyltransferase n=1 Tax=Chengkuizengella marina TaxID=2507566 RepID=A0A6N9Q3F7_9BACL|nr:glycosyltransferase family 4 protein [Chengkuizengella marina]NBI29326.1 glycosyltransferase [Chengkuizengella marina]
MKIALLTPNKDSNGGVEVYNNYLTTIFNDVDIFYYDTNNVKTRFIDKKLRPFDEIKKSYHVGREFIKAHKKNKYDLVISNGMFGWYLYFKKVDAVLVNIYHGNYIGYLKANMNSNFKKTIAFFIKGFFERISGYNKHRITVSKFNQKQLDRYYGFNSSVIHVGVDMSKFKIIPTNEARRFFSFPQKCKLYLFVGRIDENKGINTVLRIASNNPDIKFIIVGSGSLNHKLNNVIHFTEISNKDMYKLYSAVNGVLIPSYFESASLVAIEALATGTPILMNKTGYSVEINEKFPEFISTIDDFEVNFKKFNSQVESKYLKEELREWAVKNFSILVFEKRWKRFVKETLEDKNVF